jgi:hypothetical protein
MRTELVDAWQFRLGSAQLFALPEMAKFEFARIHSWGIPFGLSCLPGAFLLSSREHCK